MRSIYFKARGQRTPPGLLVVGFMVVLCLLLAACGNNTTTGSSPTPNPATPTVAPPNDLITPGVLTVGSDTTFPPQESIDPTTNKAVGFDIDLITAVAQRMGLQAKIVTTKFDTIIDDLVAKRFDVVMSAVSVTPERQKKVDFVPYFSAGESLLVQNGTIEQSDLNTANKACLSNGKPAIKLTVLQDQTAVLQLMVNHRVDAIFQDSPVTDLYVKQNPGQFEVGGSVIAAGPEGIVIRKGDTSMFNAVQTAYNQLKADGTYHRLILKWGLISEELTAIDRRVVFA